MRKIAIIALLVSSLSMANAQKFWTQKGHIHFYSDAPLEKIEADNNQVSSILDTETGDLVFTLLMKAFMFEKALMQEHFNEKYVETEKYPKAQFKGKVENLSSIDFSKAGKYDAVVSGELTIHGVTQTVKSKGVITVKADGNVSATSTFTIKLSDYKIAIPSVVKDNVSETIEINVDMNYEPYKK